MVVRACRGLTRCRRKALPSPAPPSPVTKASTKASAKASDEPSTPSKRVACWIAEWGQNWAVGAGRIGGRESSIRAAGPEDRTDPKIHVAGHRVPGAVTCRATGHWAHSRRPRSISAWHSDSPIADVLCFCSRAITSPVRRCGRGFSGSLRRCDPCRYGRLGAYYETPRRSSHRPACCL
jgi:hypothetical protein